LKLFFIVETPTVSIVQMRLILLGFFALGMSVGNAYGQRRQGTYEWRGSGDSYRFRISFFEDRETGETSRIVQFFEGDTSLVSVDIEAGDIVMQEYSRRCEATLNADGTKLNMTSSMKRKLAAAANLQQAQLRRRIASLRTEFAGVSDADELVRKCAIGQLNREVVGLATDILRPVDAEGTLYSRVLAGLR
jgi:hypothetical protein